MSSEVLVQALVLEGSPREGQDLSPAPCLLLSRWVSVSLVCGCPTSVLRGNELHLRGSLSENGEAPCSAPASVVFPSDHPTAFLLFSPTRAEKPSLSQMLPLLLPLLWAGE